MAYNYYPYQQYNGNFYNPYQATPAQTQPQIQNGGFVSVRSAQEAFNYPVALGNSVTFKDETAPFIYVKTRGFSQLEEPVFEQFQLVKVDNTQKTVEQQAPAQSEEYALKSDLVTLQQEIDLLKKKVLEHKLGVNESEEQL